MSKKYRYEVHSPIYNDQNQPIGIGITTEELDEDTVKKYEREGSILSAKKIGDVMWYDRFEWSEKMGKKESKFYNSKNGEIREN